MSKRGAKASLDFGGREVHPSAQADLRIAEPISLPRGLALRKREGARFLSDAVAACFAREMDERDLIASRKHKMLFRRLEVCAERGLIERSLKPLLEDLLAPIDHTAADRGIVKAWALALSAAEHFHIEERARIGLGESALTRELNEDGLTFGALSLELSRPAAQLDDELARRLFIARLLLSASEQKERQKGR